MVYFTIALAWFLLSVEFYPWEPDNLRTRVVGALSQSLIWPLGLCAWAGLNFEIRPESPSRFNRPPSSAPRARGGRPT